jgi:hypothetical protein
MELLQSYLIYKAASGLSAEERRRQADYERVADDADEAQASAGTAAASRPQGLRRAFTGLLVTLRLAPSARLKES